MKNLFIVIVLMWANTICALPVGNPTEPSLFNCKIACDSPCYCRFFNIGIGFYGDYVFNRHMKTAKGRDIDTTKLFTNAAYLLISFDDIIGFDNRFEIFSSLGVSRLSLNTSLVAFNAVDPFPLFELESQSAFSYSVGARAILLHCRCFSLGVEGQYFNTKPNIKRMYIAAGAVSYPGDQLITHYREWQVAPSISYRYNDFFVPYVAVKYAQSKWKLNNGNLFVIESNTNTALYNLRSQKNWGYAIGLTFSPPCCEKIGITAEARFLDEKAFYINGQMRF